MNTQYRGRHGVLEQAGIINIKGSLKGLGDGAIQPGNTTNAKDPSFANSDKKASSNCCSCETQYYI